VARGPGVCPGGLAQEALNDTVFQAVEGDHGEVAAFAQQQFRRPQPGFELVELGVDVDAHRLEAARRRVLRRPGMIAECLAHYAGEVAGGFERPGGDDRAGDAPALPLLAVLVEHVGDLFLARAVEEVCGAFARLAHSHVERAVGGEREAALGLVELHRRDADVHHHGVYRRDAHAPHFLRHQREALRMEAKHPLVAGFQVRALLDRGGIAVERVDTRAGLQQRLAVPARAESGVDDHVAGLRPQRRDHLVEEDRDVRRGHLRFAFASASSLRHSACWPAQAWSIA